MHLELAALHEGQRGQHAVHQHLRLAGDGVADGLRAALVGDVVPLRAGRLLDRHAGQVRRAADGGDREVQRLLVRQRHQLGQVVGRHRRVHHQQVRRIGQHGHAAQVLRRIEGQLAVDRRGDGQRADVAQQAACGRRAPTWRRSRCRCCRWRRACSRRSPVCFSASDSGLLMARAMMSDEPPGGYGTMMRIGLLGQAWAMRGRRRHEAPNRPPGRPASRIIEISWRDSASE